MNPLFQSFVGALIRALLLAAAGWATKHGIFTETQAGAYVEGGVLFLVPLAWAFWNQYKSRVKFLTALMSGPTSEAEIAARIKAGEPTPTVLTPPNTIPGVPAPPVTPSDK